MYHCIACKKQLETGHGYPFGGLTFDTMGGYGSGIFDPPPSTRRYTKLRVFVCDECMVKAAEQQMVEEVIVQERSPKIERRRWEYIDWTGQRE